MPTLTNCANCGKELLLRPSRLDRARYCSRACFYGPKGTIEIGWLMVPDFPSYEAHPSGVVRRIGWKPLNPTLGSKGYPKITLYRQRKSYAFSLHKVICTTFHGKPPTPHHEVAHNNGIRTDCAANNLRWATHVDNVSDMIHHGTLRRGSNHQLTKLSDSQVAEIRATYPTGRCPFGSNIAGSLAARFGVCIGTIRSVASGHSHKHSFASPKKRLMDMNKNLFETLEAGWSDGSIGASPKQVAALFGYLNAHGWSVIPVPDEAALRRAAGKVGTPIPTLAGCTVRDIPDLTVRK